LASDTSVFVYSKELEKYRYPSEHPFNTIRAKKVAKALGSMGLLPGPNTRQVPPRPADRLVLKKFHSARYLHALQQASKGKLDPEALNMGIGTSDCPVFKGLYEYALLATGATLTGAQMILDDQAKNAFNPSGGYHHAHPENASGFCYINDVALACIIFAEQNKRVLYLDVDVHHGDGVAYAFYDRSDVMTISLHQDPRTLFPGTGFADEIGTGEGKGYCINTPLPIGTYDQAYLDTVQTLVLPLIHAFEPDVIVFELGADALAGDPLANLRLTNNLYVEIINHLLSFNKPILMTGGGGYNVENTVRAWALAWSVLAGQYDDNEINIALGGVMLQTTEWRGGLRDRNLPVTEQQKDSVAAALNKTIATIKKNVFPIHNLPTT